MAKGRMIMRTIATDEKLNSLKVDDQWFFMRMLPFMDDYGRMTGNLFELKFQVIPSSSWDVKRVENSLIRIVNAELIYWLKNDTIQFRGFHKNQKIGHKPANSLYPDITKDVAIDDKRLAKVIKESNNISKGNIIKENTIKSKRSYKAQPQDLIMVVNHFKELKIVSAKSNAERFFNYYETNGWVQGKSRKPIRNWKACVNTWDFEKDVKESEQIMKICPVHHHEKGHDKRKVTSGVRTVCRKCHSSLVTLSEWQFIKIDDEQTTTRKHI
jgi:hypothetical protein